MILNSKSSSKILIRLFLFRMILMPKLVTYTLKRLRIDDNYNSTVEPSFKIKDGDVVHNAIPTEELKYIMSQTYFV